MRRREFREMMDEIREEHRLRREELRKWGEDLRERSEDLRERSEQHRDELRVIRADQKRRFDAIDAAMENDRRMTREVILELRAGRAMLRDMRHGIQANTEGLLRVLDELRREDGPSGAGA